MNDHLKDESLVIPAQAGIQIATMDSRLMLNQANLCPPPGLPRWTRAFALTPISGESIVVQSPDSHWDKPSGGRKHRMIEAWCFVKP
jgi:hypothetical protein